MAEWLTVYEPGDRFATTTDEGRVRIYEVHQDGIARLEGTQNTEGDTSG